MKYGSLIRDLAARVIIGVSIMKIFVLFINPTFLCSVGAQFITSCGFDPILARQQANHRVRG